MQFYAEVPQDLTRYAKLTAIVMMLIGGMAIMLPFYFGLFSAIILGASVLATGIVGLIYHNQLKKSGVQGAGGSLFWVYIAMGALLAFLPQFTLSLAGFLLGGALIFSGVLGYLAEQRVAASIWRKGRQAVAALLGLVLILSGATGTAWLIGFAFGFYLLVAGSNLWIGATASQLKT